MHHTMFVERSRCYGSHCHANSNYSNTVLMSDKLCLVVFCFLLNDGEIQKCFFSQTLTSFFFLNRVCCHNDDHLDVT